MRVLFTVQMLYFSELLNKKVTTQSNRSLGKLKDILFLSEDTPIVTKIKIKGKKKKPFFIHISDIKDFNNNIVVENEFVEKEKAEREYSIGQNLLNRQIIDVKGGKVVRVNDVALQDKEGQHEYYIAGVDVGFRAILRWFKLEKPTVPIYKLLGTYTRPHFLSWGDIESLELSTGNVNLKKDTKDLERMRPEDLADYLEKTNIKNVKNIISGLDEEYAVHVIEDLNVNYQAALFKRFEPEQAAKLINLLEPDESIDIILSLSRDKRHEILELLDEEKREELKQLIKYARTSIGRYINPEFILVDSEKTVGEALSKIKEEIKKGPFSMYIYVGNRDKQLVGVFPVQRLLLHDEGTQIFKLMEQDVVVAHLKTPKQIALKRMIKYKLYALPIISENKRMIGVVTFDDLAEDLEERL